MGVEGGTVEAIMEAVVLDTAAVAGAMAAVAVAAVT